jgi:cholesterol 7alpha-monooxygenase
MCSGRHVAKREAYAFVGSVLLRYDIQLAKGETNFPRSNITNPNLGAMGPMPEDDLILEVREKR